MSKELIDCCARLRARFRAGDYGARVFVGEMLVQDVEDLLDMLEGDNGLIASKEAAWALAQKRLTSLNHAHETIDTFAGLIQQATDDARDLVKARNVVATILSSRPDTTPEQMAAALGLVLTGSVSGGGLDDDDDPRWSAFVYTDQLCQKCHHPPCPCCDGWCDTLLSDDDADGGNDGFCCGGKCTYAAEPRLWWVERALNDDDDDADEPFGRPLDRAAEHRKNFLLLRFSFLSEALVRSIGTIPIEPRVEIAKLKRRLEVDCGLRPAEIVITTMILDPIDEALEHADAATKAGVQLEPDVIVEILERARAAVGDNVVIDRPRWRAATWFPPEPNKPIAVCSPDGGLRLISGRYDPDQDDPWRDCDGFPVSASGWMPERWCYLSELGWWSRPDPDWEAEAVVDAVFENPNDGDGEVVPVDLDLMTRRKNP